LPKSLRIVAFSDAVALRAERAGLPVLRLKHYKDPGLLPLARWDHGLNLMYWNRTGLVGPEFLERLCGELGIRKLLFQSRIDPRVSTALSYHLPSRLGSTVVEEVAEFLPRRQYLERMAETNLYLAPRASEGVGMTFLEAMARGCGVLAYDGPTMNEYVVHERNGFLLNSAAVEPTILERVTRRILRTARRSARRKVDTRQDWARLRATNWQAIGGTARQDHIEGHRNWLKSLPAFAAFIEGVAAGPSK
jgi:glycosyltransferase involved in cell wall biosynthesis